MQKISSLVRVDGSTWDNKYLEFDTNSSCIDIVDSVTFYRDYRIEKSSCLGVKCIPNQKSLHLSTCLLQDSGKRKLFFFEFEFQDPKEQDKFSEYLKEKEFFLSGKRAASTENKTLSFL